MAVPGDNGAGTGGRSALPPGTSTEGVEHCLRRMRSTFHLELLPNVCGNVAAGVSAELDAQLLEYNKRLEGVLLSYANPRITSKAATLHPYFPLLSVRTAADVTLFKPQVGQPLRGSVAKLGADYISLLVLGLFNATIKAENMGPDWKCSRTGAAWVRAGEGDGALELGTEVRFKVEGVESFGSFFNIAGSLREPWTGAIGAVPAPPSPAAVAAAGDSSEKEKKKRKNRKAAHDGTEPLVPVSPPLAKTGKADRKKAKGAGKAKDKTKAKDEAEAKTKAKDEAEAKTGAKGEAGAKTKGKDGAEAKAKAGGKTKGGDGDKGADAVEDGDKGRAKAKGKAKKKGSKGAGTAPEASSSGAKERGGRKRKAEAEPEPTPTAPESGEPKRKKKKRSKEERP